MPISSSSPSLQPIFDEMQGQSVGIIEHRFTEAQSKLRRFGSYNVGWISFRRDQAGLACLRWWAERCIEWCYDRVEESRFADQKYLDEFPIRFEAVRVIQHKGANVGPWNVANYPITLHGEEIRVDGQPLIFFHFHGFKVLSSWLFDTNFGMFHARPSRLVRERSSVRTFVNCGTSVLKLDRSAVCEPVAATKAAVSGSSCAARGWARNLVLAS